MKILTYKREGNKQIRKTKDLPDSWKIKTFSNNMQEEINCRSCGKKILFGDGYTSQEIFTIDGFWGYIVCPECHEKENGR